MFVLPLAATLRRWEGSRFRHRPPCGRLLELTSFCRQLFLLDTQKEPKRCPLLPIAREARLKGNGSRVARAALRAVSLKNPRADGLAPARGQHSTVGRFAISISCCSFLVVRRGRRCGVAQRSMPQWGIEPHERASFAGWRPSFWPPSADAPIGTRILRADIESAPTVDHKFCNYAKLSGASGTPPPTDNFKIGN